MENLPDVSLAESVASERTVDFLATAADIGIDAALSSGAFDGVPVAGAITGLWRAQHEVRQILYLRKIANFLRGIATASIEERTAFVDRLRKAGEMKSFGEAILLLIERVDDMSKPEIIGKILAAHVSGKIEYEKAMRVAAIVDRCYASDMKYLLDFKAGTQGRIVPIAESLFAAGVLSTTGSDGGTWDDPTSGGIMYDLNEYGHILVTHGLRS
jgi:hypothetical protein